MSSKPRQFEVGNIYHIIKRGVDGRKIFLNNQDDSRFILGLEFFNNESSINLWDLVRGEQACEGSCGKSDFPTAENTIGKRLAEYRENKGKIIVELMAFTLMPNHFHLIIREIIDRGISRYMQKIGGYTGYFNKQHNRRGNLFESI